MSDEHIEVAFVENIVKTLVEKPDAVRVERSMDEKGVLLELHVDNGDLGRVIGKRGSTSQSIRTLLRSLGARRNARYNLKVIDEKGNSHDGNHADSAPATED